MANWLSRLVQSLFNGSERALPAQLIASMVDLDQAMELADDREVRARLDGINRAILEEGAKSKSVVDQIGAAINARLILASKMNDAELIRYVQHLQNRYGVAVSPAVYAKYAAGVPEDAFKDRKKLEAELQTLSYRLRLAYAISHIRDEYLAVIRQTCFVSLAASFFLIAGSLGVQWLVRGGPAHLNLALVALIGFVGSVTSIARRANKLLASSPLEEDPVIQASALQQGRASLWIAALTGPVFAVVLLLVFMSGEFSIEGLTPHFDNVPITPGATVDFQIFHYGFNVEDASDSAKIVVWAFIAGFAEQFVPDVLDRFTNQAQKKG